MKNTIVTRWLICPLGLWLLSQSCGQCFYDPGQQRWLTRDPSGERGGGNLFEFAGNNPLINRDSEGLCVQLPDSGVGNFRGNLFGHQWPFNGPASSLTFNVCCPPVYPFLSTWGVKSTGPPPLETPHGNNFPGSFTTVALPRGNGPCYTITIRVTTSSTLDYYQNPIGNFVSTIRIAGGCCCTPTPTITRSDPPTNPGIYNPPPPLNPNPHAP
jgi:hypothetical protein